MREDLSVKITWIAAIATIIAAVIASTPIVIQLFSDNSKERSVRIDKMDNSIFINGNNNSIKKVEPAQ